MTALDEFGRFNELRVSFCLSTAHERVSAPELHTEHEVTCVKYGASALTQVEGLKGLSPFCCSRCRHPKQQSSQQLQVLPHNHHLVSALNALLR